MPMDYCEFVDTYLYEREYCPPTSQEIVYLSLSFLKLTVDEGYITELKKNNQQRLAELKQSIIQNGLQSPGLLVYDNTRIKLQDGNHRFIICDELSYMSFPVKFQKSEGKIKTGGLAYKNIIEELLKGKI